MKPKPQTRWALVMNAKYINHYYMRFCRKDVIRSVISDERQQRRNAQYDDLTDAQFWRILKRKRSWGVRRINLTVASETGR